MLYRFNLHYVFINKLERMPKIFDKTLEKLDYRDDRQRRFGIGRIYSLGEVDFIQGMLDFGNCKNSVGLKPNAELRKDAKAPSYNIGTDLGIS